ncbi:MAG: peptidoglycan-binding lysin protein [Herbinix sp.]|jgi:LysM repeat protein|nr:peptidoglycan-binding lysin protein [Herbinix sp.]
MSDYAIFFDKDNITYRLPVNPEELEVSSSQAIEKYEILKLGQIAVPTHMELNEYSFETELPHESLNYVETLKGFENAESYLNLFRTWREELAPIRFLAGKATSDYSMENDIINTLVLIESLTITEKAGEERDKYVSFKLVEYKEYDKQEGLLVVDEAKGKAAKSKKNTKNPKNKGYYVIKSGDTLWAIAKKYYSDGSKYTKIYNANKEIIKNPSLIYAGQKLVIPS